MSKRKLHAIILIFTAAAVLSSAAVCNLCGISPGSSTDEDQDGQATATTQETTTATTDTTPDGSEAAPQNNAPKITEVFLDDENMTDFLKTETLPARYEQNFYYFTIIAEDEDGDEMDFDIESTHGIVSDITRLANDSVAFTWESPENTEGSDTPLSVQIDVTVSDTAGGNDTFTIVIALLPVEGERTDEETRIDFEILADSSLSGYIIKDTQIRTGVILVGDWDNNKQIKGYLSFDISELSAIPGFEVISAKLVFDHINKSGSPELVGEKIDFKSFDYGESLDEADFAVGGEKFPMGH